MRRLGFVLIFTFFLAAVFSSASLDRRLNVEATLERPFADIEQRTLSVPVPLTRPISLNLEQAEHLHLVIQGYGADHVVVLELEIEGGTVETVLDANERARRFLCVPNEKSVCHIAVRITGDEPVSIRLVPNSGKVFVKQLELEPVTSKRQGAATGLKIFLGFGILLIVGPFLVWLRRWPGAEQYALALGGLLWIGYASTIGLFVSLAYAILGYLFILYIAKLQERRARALVGTISGAALLVLLLKFAIPVMAGVFANPGGLWLAFPLGISYLAIRIVDLLLASYARTLRGFNFRDYLAFVFSPHTLPAGPIQLYSDYLRAPIEPYSLVDFTAGVARMLMGLGKKLLADSILLPLVSNKMTAFLSGTGDLDVSAVTMLFGNLLYIYLDFSAYCDLAIGSARTGGRRLPENFDWPLLRSGVRAYWRHWHMTLSQWVMRRVYFPAFLTSRSSVLATMAAMFVIGMWHAPTVCWAFWALHHSLMLVTEGKLFPNIRTPRAAHPSLYLQLSKVFKYLVGLIFMLFWVSLGHSFTLFSDPKIALICYFEALRFPYHLIGNLVDLVIL